MNALLSFCLRNRITVLIITAALTLLSLFVVTQLPVDVFPELKVPRVTIQTEAGGLSAARPIRSESKRVLFVFGEKARYAAASSITSHRM